MFTKRTSPFLRETAYFPYQTGYPSLKKYLPYHSLFCKNTGPTFSSEFYRSPLLNNIRLLTAEGHFMNQKISNAYKSLCTEYYEIDKPNPPKEALDCYLSYAADAKGQLLEPMCGSGRFLIPMARQGYTITGFDNSFSMLNSCRKKCQKEKINSTLLETSFENFTSNSMYKLIFIPSGSFCLLTKQEEISHALNVIHKHLEDKGKFVFEIDTPMSMTIDGNWKGSWVERADGAKLVSHSLARFDSISKIQSSLHRYELWENNAVKKTEVEEFYLRLYTISEIEKILEQHKFKILNKWIPYTKVIPDDKAEYVLLECMKSC
jgi:Methyltransferase domain